MIKLFKKLTKKEIMYAIIPNIISGVTSEVKIFFLFIFPLCKQ